VAKPLAVVPDLEVELDRLYSLAPSEFTSERNDLARRLKQAGRDDAAAEVKQLRKPTVPVWAVNQLARQDSDLVSGLLEASEQLRAAHSGGEPSTLRQATAAQREALQALTHRAHDLLSAEGQSASSGTIERIASTLRAAALDPANRELLEQGRLGQELDPSGFDALAGVPIPAGAPPRTPRKREKPALDLRRQKRLEKLREEARKAGEAADEAERQAKSAATAATRARSTAERAQAALEAAERRSD
jgi:hypothetical protein